MDVKKLLETIHLAEKLKDVTRHSYTSGGRHESVAEHSWRLALMAFFLRDEFPQADMDKVIQMCLIHDLGEIFIGDIPSFLKTADDERREQEQLADWVNAMPTPYREELCQLYNEMDALESQEARIYKALDKLEAVIQHNEADISTWLENEYALNLTYGEDSVSFCDYLKAFRRCVRDETKEKIHAAERQHICEGKDSLQK